MQIARKYAHDNNLSENKDLKKSRPSSGFENK